MKAFERIYLDEVSEKAVCIYRYLRDRQGKNDCCYPSHKRIAHDNKCSVSTVKRAIQELEQKGYIRKVNRRRANGSNTSNIYYCL